MIPRKLQYVVAALVLAILAMGFYLVHLKRKAESIAAPPATQALTAPVSGPAEQMTLYLANDEDDSLRPEHHLLGAAQRPWRARPPRPAHADRALPAEGFRAPAGRRSRRA